MWCTCPNVRVSPTVPSRTSPKSSRNWGGSRSSRSRTAYAGCWSTSTAGATPRCGIRPHCRGDQDLVSVPRQAERLRPFMLELLDRYRHKIKSAEELRDIIGPRPRKKRVIMCHGVFDVVHPGHVRHLLYARSKADLLIASITADHHITKGTHRPHVPQDLRAVNLAAFEVVDYVVIDKNAKPIENIRIIQPD